MIAPADNIADVLPDWLCAQPRWAPWKAKWNAKRGKFDKIPVRPDAPECGLSTAKVDQWGTFEAALAACKKHDLAGVGIVLTGIKGVTGIDLDGANGPDGRPQPWAREILRDLAALGAYLEVSPSGNGYRGFLRAQLGQGDWDNHDQGIEVYEGAKSRFLTVTGREVKP
jgi:primase-polymerase (primpol)-like protein